MTPHQDLIAFIGGGNMASALLGGLIKAGVDAARLRVVEPLPAQREALAQRFGLQALAQADATLAQAGLVVWAVKPQAFGAAAAACAGHVERALHLSVMAGIPSLAITRASGSHRVVRSMPNTPALIGRGIAGLFATPGVTADDRLRVEQMLAPTGQTLWLDRESDLDAVTALSGSGPAYVFYFIEAMMQAAVQMGLSAEQGRQLALATFDGATALAAGSPEAPHVLRERVTSKGGTTFAALQSLQGDGVQAAFVRALHAARRRAQELGDEFGS